MKWTTLSEGKTNLHARQSAESLPVASGLPLTLALPQGEGIPHPALRRVEALWIGESAAYGSPSPQGEGIPHPALRRVEALWIGESAAYGSPSPQGEGWGEGEETLRKPACLRTADEVDYAKAKENNAPRQAKRRVPDTCKRPSRSFLARRGRKLVAAASLHPSVLRSCHVCAPTEHCAARSLRLG